MLNWYIKHGCIISWLVSHLLLTLFVQAILRKADTNQSADISFPEFVEYMREHERKLKLAFSDLDRNNDGMAVAAFVWLLNIVM